MAPRDKDASRTTEWSAQSNVQDAWATHLHMDLEVSFEEKVLSGYVEFQVEAKPGTRSFDLDTRDLEIKKVEVDEAQTKILHKEAHSVEAFGQGLSVPITKEKCVVRVHYSTTPASSACQWLDPEATADKKYPYLFTQCQAIHARSLLPCQDVPAAKCPVSARIKVPSWATALMSAIMDTHTEGCFTFKQTVPIPSYLIALAVGQLEQRKISDRVSVWSEPSVVDDALKEFADTEKFLTTAEEIMGLKYQWGRYDLLCMPPSFPYGGMENPCLTFVTPTLLAKDRSLVDVVAHEIAHSWTGNLVTNHTWEHFWLNEGWTVWAERHIVAAMRGKDSTYFSIAHHNGWSHLRDDVTHLMDIGNAQYTQLVPNLEGVDPDDSFSSVPYEKGFNVLYSIQQKVGNERFMTFAKAYIDAFKFRTITSAQFKAFCIEKLPETASFNWDKLYFTDGMPDEPSFDTSALKESRDFADQLARPGPAPPKEIWKNWDHERRILALEHLITLPPLADKRCAELGELYGIAESENYEILFRYCQIVLMQEDAQWVYPIVTKILTSQGRMKFTRPLYRHLAGASDQGYRVALSTFDQMKQTYHPICRKMVESDLERIKAGRPRMGLDCCDGKSCRGWAMYAVAGAVAFMAYRIMQNKCPIPFMS